MLTCRMRTPAFALSAAPARCANRLSMNVPHRLVPTVAHVIHSRAVTIAHAPATSLVRRVRARRRSAIHLHATMAEHALIARTHIPAYVLPDSLVATVNCLSITACRILARTEALASTHLRMDTHAIVLRSLLVFSARRLLTHAPAIPAKMAAPALPLALISRVPVLQNIHFRHALFALALDLTAILEAL